MRALTVGSVVGLIFLSEQPAHAYVDPGSGLLAWQMLGASLAGSFFLLRQRLRKLWGGDSKGPATNAAQPKGDLQS